MVFEIGLLESQDVDFFLRGWMKGEVYEKESRITRGISGILDAAARVKKCEDEPRRTAHGVLKLH
jgi:hypothetical protein